ncbi:hypothetical protein RU01_03250 [Rhodococcus sp. MEB064]|nr:hypothetical protein RU01_03250 [Rhodococcus sp. MEB064]
MLDAAAVSVVMDAASAPDGHDFDLVSVASSGSVDRSLSVTGPATMCVRTGAAVLADDLEFSPGWSSTRSARGGPAEAPRHSCRQWRT